MNRLNGWQRLWLLASVGVQLWWLPRWQIWDYLEGPFECKEMIGGSFKCTGSYDTLESALLYDLKGFAGLLGFCLAAYAVAHAAVLIFSWVRRGFQR